MEQRFHLEAAFREIDACEDINKLTKLKKQIIKSQKNEKAVAREVIVQHRKEIIVCHMVKIVIKTAGRKRSEVLRKRIIPPKKTKRISKWAGLIN